MGFKVIFKVVLNFFSELLLRSALDAASRQVLKSAVEIAEQSGKSGTEKFQMAVAYVAKEGTQSLKTVSVQRLGELIEEQVAQLNK